MAASADTGSDLVSFSTIFRAVWLARWYVLVGLVLGGAGGAVLAYSMAEVYRADVVIVPVKGNARGGLSGALGQLGGIAAMAGLDLNSADNTIEYQQYLRSRALTQHFIEENQLLPQLYPKLWNAETKSWRVDNKNDIPTMSQAVTLFNRRVREVSEDKRTNVLTVAINWRDRTRAATLANDYVQMANRELAKRAVAEAQSTAKYLSTTLESTATLGVQQALSRLLEEQLQTVALANTRRDFAFRVVDPAVALDADDFARPARAVIAFAAGLAGAVFGMALWLLLTSRRALRTPE
jgi:uncharacterized protein involved in exopolysaccharide biosynthesis